MRKAKKLWALLLAVLILCATACGKEETYTLMDYMEEDLTPYVTLGQYKDLTLAADPIVVSDAQVEEYLKSLISARTTYEEYDEPVTDRLTEAGDYLLVDFMGFIEGEQFEGGTAEGRNVLLADGNGYIDWFDDELFGVMPGTVVETTNFFPEDYYENVAGKEVTFKITVHGIVGHYTIPTLNDEFIKAETGYETVEEYRTLIYEAFLAEATQEANLTRYQIMWDAIMNNATIHSLPEEQVMFYYTSDRSYYESVAAEYGYTYEDYLAACGVDDSYVKEMVEDVIREELVLYSIVKAENISLTEEDYAEGLAYYAEVQGVTAEELEAKYGREYIESNLLWDKVIYALFDTTTFITE